MRIPCPFCGSRDLSEFVTRGEVLTARPALDADEETMAAGVYLRENVCGETREYWYHAQGCRNWLIVLRDTRTHEIRSASFARTVAEARPQERRGAGS